MGSSCLIQVFFLVLAYPGCCTVVINLYDTGDTNFRDLMFEVCAWGLFPYALAAQTAQNLDMSQLSKRYCVDALGFHQNPMLLHHLHAFLGKLQALPQLFHGTDSDGDDE